jgi:hypothetical protein
MSKFTGKNFGYSSCRGKFVNDFNHTRRVAPTGVAPKRVDSSSVSEKPCPWLVVEGPRCGKTEEGSGKKDSAFRGIKPENAASVKDAAQKN